MSRFMPVNPCVKQASIGAAETGTTSQSSPNGSARGAATTSGDSQMNFQSQPDLNSMLEQAKWAFTTRRVQRTDVAGLSPALATAVAGDLVLARISSIGQHRRIQLSSGRPSESYLGDLVVLCCGARYAPDQFEGLAELDVEGADLLAGGGVLGRMRQANGRMRTPTRLTPLGLLTDARGEVLNIGRYALATRRRAGRMQVIGVVGASMNAGKTTAVASLAHGLRRSGRRVAALKLTGTGAFGDFNAYSDAGAQVVADFTDAGMPTTYLQPLRRIEAGIETLLAHAEASGADVAVVELADGLFQGETAALLRSGWLRRQLTGVLFTAGDALGSVGGVTHLRELGLEPVAVSGMVTTSPLGAAEAQAAVDITMLTRDALRDPDVASQCLEEAASAPRGRVYELASRSSPAPLPDRHLARNAAA